jgi:N-acetylmuramic acid 6-phosphate etherase
MQATTSEQLIASSALEVAAGRLYNAPVSNDFAADFGKLLDTLESDATVAKIAKHIEFEAEIYRKNGRVTYFADQYMLDLFTDTTERSPTFMLPGFRRIDDDTMPEPWAFVRNPLLPAADAMRRALGNREMRCLAWQPADYIAMQVPESIVNNPPRISAADLCKIPVGNEAVPSRYATGNDAAVLFCYNNAPADLKAAADKEAEKFAHYVTMDAFCGELPATRLKVFDRLAVKLQWNTISTGTMVCLGRVSGNWMSYVAISNKKLIDRAIRLISELGGVDYHTACVELFRTIAEPDGTPAVRQTLERIAAEK